MHIAAVIIVCIAGTTAAGFLSAAFIALIVHDDAEIHQLQEEYAEARRKGPLEEWLWGWKVFRLSQVACHWRSRSEVRMSVWVGLISSAVAIIAVQFL